MQAIRVESLGGTEVLQLKTIDDLAPDNDQVLVRVYAAGVNPVDTYIRAGEQGYDPQVPYTPGFDGAGIVESVGDNVKRWSKGDRVYIAGSVTGSYAEYALCTSDQIHCLPEQISFAQGATVYVPYATAYRGLIHRAAARSGETILVHGASGSVGMAAVQFAASLGMRVIATASSEAGQVLAAEQGADLVLDHSDSAHYSAIMDFTENRGVDVIMEMAAHINLANDLKILAHKGRVVVIGNRKPIEINPRDAMACDGAILGMSMANIDQADQKSIHAAIVAGLSTGVLNPVVRCELPLDEAAHAHELVMQSGANGKIVLIP